MWFKSVNRLSLSYGLQQAIPEPRSRQRASPVPSFYFPVYRTQPAMTGGSERSGGTVRSSEIYVGVSRGYRQVF